MRYRFRYRRQRRERVSLESFGHLLNHHLSISFSFRFLTCSLPCASMPPWSRGLMTAPIPATVRGLVDASETAQSGVSQMRRGDGAHRLGATMGPDLVHVPDLPAQL